MNIDDESDDSVLIAEIKSRAARDKVAFDKRTDEDKQAIREAAEAREQTRVATMTPEEKERWLAQRKLEVKAKREKEELEKQKASEKSRQSLHHAQGELKEKIEQEQIKAMVSAKTKAKVDSVKHRNEIRDQIKADKDRRAAEQAKELERIKKAKEEEAAKKVTKH